MFAEILSPRCYVVFSVTKRDGSRIRHSGFDSTKAVFDKLFHIRRRKYNGADFRQIIFKLLFGDPYCGHAVLRKVMFQTVMFLAVGFKDVVFSQFLKTYVKKGDRDLFPLAVFKNITRFCLDNSVFKRLDDSDFKIV